MLYGKFHAHRSFQTRNIMPKIYLFCYFEKNKQTALKIKVHIIGKMYEGKCIILGNNVSSNKIESQKKVRKLQQHKLLLHFLVICLLFAFVAS